MTSRLSKEELVEQARAHYRNSHWQTPSRLGAPLERLLGELALRPDFVAQKDGMEHFVYAPGKVTRSTFHLMKQVLFELEQKTVFCHVVIVCDDNISRANEAVLRRMGLGILLIRQDVPHVELADPQLRCFRLPTTFDRVPTRYRRGVRESLHKIHCGDVCVGVLDLAQVLETALTDHGVAVNTLGAKIREATRSGVLRRLAADAANRVNWPRINRAHPGNHSARRRHIVSRVQEIVDDCLAVLFSLD